MPQQHLQIYTSNKQDIIESIAIDICIDFRGEGGTKLREIIIFHLERFWKILEKKEIK